MSLYIGNMSEHTRKDELEHVFRRFGHCNVQLKREGYGFVVFDFPPNATKALRALKGRNICGEPLTLTWSNKQPAGSFQRFPRGGGKIYEPRRGRNSERIGHARRKMGSDGWRDQEMGNDGRAESVGVPGEERGYHQDDFKDYVREERDYREEFRDDGSGVVPALEENGRWGEPIQDTSAGNGNENALEFDRYEPYHGYDMKHDDNHIGYRGSSPRATSLENMARVRIGEETVNRPKDSKFRQTCYRCGEPGHKMRDCPKQHSSRRKYERLDGRRNNKIDGNHRIEDEDKFRSESWSKMRSSGDALSMRNQRDERRGSASRQYHSPLRNKLSPMAKETDRHRRREYGGKKRCRNEVESPKRPRGKRSRRSTSSSLHSDYSTSHSLPNSRSPKSLRKSRFRSRSRSVSSRSHSSSSKLISSSKSPHRNGKSSDYRRSSSHRSLSVSLNQPLPSSAKKIEPNSKSSSINATALECMDHLVVQGHKNGSAMESVNVQSKDEGLAVNGTSAVQSTVVDDIENDQCVQVDNDKNRSLRPSDTLADLTKSLVTRNLSTEVVKEKELSCHTETPLVHDIQKGIQNQVSETCVNSHSRHTTAISTEEMFMVLKNYGLELPKDNEETLSVDAFFGSARLWPWHIVYYRRLKKGPISAENYARRVAQNQEFGIVDKYIRSSSGWGEVDLVNS
ncbi:serine/arginine-rich splicing factor 4 [Arachis ipaensis]|uniref:serine/arginine-rich splicing factor 4 n=1 Tax=Arachis ipaensis TaxID=130454 RepID=UPI0007AEE951|nr:serine/arginine-rich splicing factor 4 [Arachis ipaensis]